MFYKRIVFIWCDYVNKHVYLKWFYSIFLVVVANQGVFNKIVDEFEKKKSYIGIIFKHGELLRDIREGEARKGEYLDYILNILKVYSALLL